MSNPRRFQFVVLACLSACMTSKPAPAPEPLAGPRYDFSPTPPCSPVGTTKLTVAIVSPRWQAPTQSGLSMVNMGVAYTQPKILLDVAPAMRADFLELVSCRGYLAKGPFDSFEAMVYPDREASHLLLEPELQLDVDIPTISMVEKSFLGGLLKDKSGGQLTGTATVGGRVTLSLKEPVTNTRMWSRSIDIAPETFAFTSVSSYSSALSVPQAKLAVLNDDGLRRGLQPKLEAMYSRILTTADNYLDRRELTTVATQAADVRKKATIGVPR